jgi:hypothetical protein
LCQIFYNHLIKRQRKYANFFEWPHKNTKELGIVKCLIESLEKEGCHSYSDLQSNTPDPPDCVAKDKSGRLVGIEVSELVDLKTVNDAQHNKAFPRYWDKEEVANGIQSIIFKKGQKKIHGGPYSSTILIIFTDETFIDPNDLIPYLKEFKFQKIVQFDDIYLLFSYDPRIHRYPYLKLKTADNLLLQGMA